MLEYTGAGDGARLMMLMLHDDAKREYAYGPAQGLPNTRVGTFTQELYDESGKEGLDCDQHEGRLEDDLLIRQLTSAEGRMLDKQFHKVPMGCRERL